jgi:hypothetical protein
MYKINIIITVVIGVLMSSVYKMKSPMKKTRFNEFLVIRIVDSYKEFKKDLWWNDFDYTTFHKSAFREINLAMRQHNCTLSKDAMKILYQPYYANETKCMYI